MSEQRGELGERITPPGGTLASVLANASQVAPCANRPLTMAMIRLRSSAVSSPQLSIKASSSVEPASDSASSCVGSGVSSERYVVGSSPTGPTSILICVFQHGSLLVGCWISTVKRGTVSQTVTLRPRKHALQGLKRHPHCLGLRSSVGAHIEPQSRLDRFVPHQFHQLSRNQPCRPPEFVGRRVMSMVGGLLDRPTNC